MHHPKSFLVSSMKSILACALLCVRVQKFSLCFHCDSDRCGLMSDLAVVGVFSAVILSWTWTFSVSGFQLCFSGAWLSCGSCHENPVKNFKSE